MFDTCVHIDVHNRKRYRCREKLAKEQLKCKRRPPPERKRNRISPGRCANKSKGTQNPNCNDDAYRVTLSPRRRRAPEDRERDKQRAEYMATGGDGRSRRRRVAAARRVLVDDDPPVPVSGSSLERGALVPVIFSAAGPLVAGRGAVEPETGRRPRFLVFHAHPQIVELPEVAVLEEVRDACTTKGPKRKTHAHTYGILWHTLAAQACN